MTQRLTGVIYKGDKFYVAQALELGVVSQGRTLAEAEANLKEAVELYLEDDDVEIRPISGTPQVKKFAVKR